MSRVEFISVSFVLLVIVLAMMVLLGPAIGAVADAMPNTNQESLLASTWTWVVQTVEGSHGLDKHSAGYIDALDCFSNPSAQLYTMFPRASKKIDVCNLGNLFYFRVWVKRGGNGSNTWWDERTAYLRDEITSMEQFQAYAKDMGYDLYNGIVDFIQ